MNICPQNVHPVKTLISLSALESNPNLEKNDARSFTMILSRRQATNDATILP